MSGLEFKIPFLLKRSTENPEDSITISYDTMSLCSITGCSAQVRPAGRTKLLAKFGGAEQVCWGHILASSELVELEGPGRLIRLPNDKHVAGTTDLSGHQDDLKSIKAILKKNGVDVDDEVVKEYLLDLLTTSHWDECRDNLQKGGRKKIPFSFFLKDRQTLSLRDQAAAMITLKWADEGSSSRDRMKRESGESSDTCNGCHAKGITRTHGASWSKLKNKLDFSCLDCLAEILKQLCKTDPLLSFFPEIGVNGVFLYQNPFYDPSSIVPFRSAEKRSSAITRISRKPTSTRRCFCLLLVLIHPKIKRHS